MEAPSLPCEFGVQGAVNDFGSVKAKNIIGVGIFVDRVFPESTLFHRLSPSSLESVDLERAQI